MKELITLTNTFIQDFLDAVYKEDNKTVKFINVKTKGNSHNKYKSLPIFAETPISETNKVVRAYKLTEDFVKFNLLIVYGVVDLSDKSQICEVLSSVIVKLTIESKVRYVYLIECQGFLKIGKAENLNNRLKAYMTHSPKFTLIGYIESTIADYELKEKKLIHKFKHLIYTRNEWFYYSKEIIVEFKSQNNFKEINKTFPTEMYSPIQ